MDGARVCKHSLSPKMVGKFIVAVSKDNNFIVQNTHSGLIERYKLSAGEKTSYSTCLSTLIAVTNIA